MRDIPPKKIAYVDESGFDTFYHREYGYAPRGEKMYDTVAGRRFQRNNLVAAKLGDELVAAMWYSENTDSAIFEIWFQERLLPCLPEETVIVMDNASFHRKEKLLRLAEPYPVRLVFLPPYSPELNPIEKIWAILKRWLKMNMRDYSSFDDAIYAALNFNY